MACVSGPTLWFWLCVDRGLTGVESASGKPIYNTESCTSLTSTSTACKAANVAAYGTTTVCKDTQFAATPWAVCPAPSLPPAPYTGPDVSSRANKFNYGIGETWSMTMNKSAQGVNVYFIDCEDNSAEAVAAIKAAGWAPVAYFSAGTYEDWRADASQFTAADKGASNGWPGEAWIDTRSANVRAIMAARIKMCADKGFVALDPDNMDAYGNGGGGKGLTKADAVDYFTFLKNTADLYGLKIGLKNAMEILGMANSATQKMYELADFCVNESCADYAECNTYLDNGFTATGKVVYHISYKSAKFKIACNQQTAYGMRAILKKLALKNEPWTKCPGA